MRSRFIFPVRFSGCFAYNMVTCKLRGLTDNGLIEVSKGQWVYVFYEVNYGVSTAPLSDKLTLFWVEQ